MMLSKKIQCPADLTESMLVFPSNLGWMALVMAGNAVRRLTFGHRSKTDAMKCIASLAGGAKCPIQRCVENHVVRDDLLSRLQAYAAGRPDTFADIAIDLGETGEFRRRVMEVCRQIPYGRTVSYSELAAEAGSPRAARAVGNCMAANPIPLIVPCHRVLCSDGRIGNYSAPGGANMKRRLLELEQKQSRR